MNKPYQKSSPQPGGGRAGQKHQLLSEVIETYWPDLLAGIRIYVKRLGLAGDLHVVETLAEEILQETIVTALESSENYDPGRPARPWLLGIALNKIRRMRRTQEHENHHVTLVADTSPVLKAVQRTDAEALSEGEMFDILYETAEQRNPHVHPSLDDLLSLVNANDQEVLKLAFADDIRGRELAAELGISEGAAYVRLHRAIARLRDAYFQTERKSGE